MHLPLHPPRQRTGLLLLPLFLAASGLTQTAAPPSERAYTLTTRVPITILDIVVTDSNNQPVHNLHQSDFTILEDKLEVHPASFEEHRTDTSPVQPAKPNPTQLNLPPNTFTNATPTDAGPVNVLLLDALNLPTQDQAMLRQQMLALLPKLPPRARIAVFLLSHRLSILQGFTTDTDLLKAALNSKQILPSPAAEEDPWRDILAISSEDTAEPGWITVDREGESSALRGESELNAMRQLARYLAGIPGRKNLIWFGGSFPLQFPPFPDNEAFPAPGSATAGRANSLRSQSYDFQAELRNATDMLARAHVAVFPIDGHGLEANLTPGLQVSPNDKGAPSWQQKNADYMNVTEHFTIETIAEQTGGKAFYNTNGLSQAFEQALDLGSNFYTVAYTPINQKLDSRFRSISVKVAQPGLHLTYRNGYYAVMPEVGLNGTKINAPTPVQSALLRGSPEPTQILFKVRVTPALAASTVPANNKPDTKQMHPPFRILTLSYLIDVNHIDFAPGPDTNYRGDFEYTVLVYTADGDQVVNTVAKTVSPILPPAVFQSMLRGGANAHQDVAIPATGDFFLRIAVHDLTSNRVGAIEIPTASLSQDAPPSPTATK